MKKLKFQFYRTLFSLSSRIAEIFMKISIFAMHEANLLLPDDPEEKPKSSFSDFIKSTEKK